MAKAIALARMTIERQQAFDLARGAIVTACALALVAAGQAFPLL